jgi:hypothetical protein
MCLAAALLVGVSLGCDEGGSADKKSVVGSTLTKSIDFPQAMLFDAPMPATTDPSVTLMPLGPTPVLHPGIGGLMSLQVDDPKHRDVAATLMQFGGDDSHVRVPVPDDQSGDIVENEFDLNAQLCSGLCDAIFTIVVQQKVELEDGAISAPAEREVVLDCRKLGDHAACEAGEGEAPDGGAPAGEGDGVQASQLLCGDVTEGEIALSGDPVLDARLDAARQLEVIETALADQFGATLAAVATSLGLGAESSAQDVADALGARLSEETEAGLSLLLGNPGCAIRRAQVEFALMACDPDGVDSLEALDCAGTCEPIDDVASCDGAAHNGCRGVTQDVACDGTCTGACQVELTGPASCGGTCIGECDGECPDDGMGGCAGPCDGDCTGLCREPSDGECGGTCVGICDETVDGTPSCDEPLAPYCAPAADEALSCAGDCFGDVELSAGSSACRPSALSVGDTLPRCAPPLVQLSFGFALDLDAGAQDSLAMLVQGLNDPLAAMIDIRSRLELLERAAHALDDAGEEIEGVLEARLAANPGDAALACAGEQIPNADGWLADEATAIGDLRGEIETVLAVVDVAQP